MIKWIKQQLRLSMNGVASTVMRQAGLEYHVNFGVELPRLQAIANECAERFGNDNATVPSDFASIAQQLWKENIRESKILACMLMPTGCFPASLCDVWVDEVPNAEIAQMSSMLLFSRLPYSPTAIFVWIASDRPMRLLCGLLTATRLLMHGTAFTPSAIDELRDQACSCLASDSLPIRQAAQNLLDRL